MKTPTNLNEFNQAERPARQLLERLGWIYVPRDVLVAERNDDREVLLKSRLRRALIRLNEWMTEEQAEQTVFKLEHIDATNMVRNQTVHEYLTYGMPLNVDVSPKRKTRIVRFFDFEHPEGSLNEFVVTTQFHVHRGSEWSNLNDERAVIPDLVLFVNGIPLVVMEAKSPSLLEEWRLQAIGQLRRYQEAGLEWQGAGVPELFYYNLLCVAHCGAAAVYSAFGAPSNVYAEWKMVLPYSEKEVQDRFGVVPQGQAQLIIGLLSPSTLLEILRDFVVYEPERGRLVKKLPRYHQYRAVRATLERIMEGQGGVVWHTQGSGKSLTMLWVATKLYREPRLHNPSIVVVTDRTQLDRQITQTFQRCGFPAPEQASDTRDLRCLLSARSGHTVMTTLQKFEDVLITSENEIDVLNPSENIIIMVDEAHRTQYGTLGARMSQALPNAKLIGFTGTPIDRDFRYSTMHRFGQIIDTYTIPQSVADGATVPILYQSRLPGLALEGPESLDDLFEALFGDKPAAVKAKLFRRYANKETIATAERRIQMIALDIANHFKKYIRPNGFKAQVVAPSRSAALHYAKCLNEFGLSTFPIVTTNHNDGPEFREARQLDQEQVVSSFVDPQGEPEILVVVDMLLTGFDAPIEQVLYLDRSLREHSLLQAIARVNRRFSHVKDGVATEKRHGLVIDYHGVSQDLEAALSTFERQDVQETMQMLKANPAPIIESIAVKAEAYFKDLNLDDIWACVGIFAPDDLTEGHYKADLFARFRADYSDFARLMDRFLPDPCALAYIDRLAGLAMIHAYVRTQYCREDTDLDWAEAGAKVKALVHERIDASVHPLMKPLSIFAHDFEQKIAALPNQRAQASVMEHALRAQIHERLAENPAFYETLSKQLARIIEDWRNHLIASAEVCQRCLELRRQIQNRADVAASQGFSTLSMAIYELLDCHSRDTDPPVPKLTEYTPNQPDFDEETRNVALKLEIAVDHHKGVIDWQLNSDVLREMRRDIKRELRNSGEFSELNLVQIANQIVEMAKRQANP